MERGNGSPLQVTSVPGPLVGDLGPSAHELLELLRDAGRGTGRSFPLNPTAPEHDNSPYSGLSAFTGNLIMVSPQLLAKEGLPTREEVASLPRGEVLVRPVLAAVIVIIAVVAIAGGAAYYVNRQHMTASTTTSSSTAKTTLTTTVTSSTTTTMTTTTSYSLSSPTLSNYKPRPEHQ